MTLKPLSIEDMEQVRIWRNTIPETLRTPFMLTKEQQEDYYLSVICDRKSTTRYWGFWVDRHFIGYGGIENIEWENSRGEISVLIDPNKRLKGNGREAVRLILDQAFNYLNLHSVHGECYYCSQAVKFWKKLIDVEWATSENIPDTKYFKGAYYGSLYFTFTRLP